MSTNKKGYFIVFEGPDGSGKTTVIKEVLNKLQKQISNLKFVLTREPGGNNNVIAEDIRNILLNKIEYKIDDRAEALLFAASRAQHVKDFILPNLLANNIVLCDRFVTSSLVYQGIGRKLGIKEVYDINKFAIRNVLPDLTFVLMVKPEVGLKRIQSNKNRENNRLDQEKIKLHKDVYLGYKKILRENKNNNFIEIDANKSIDEIANKITNIIVKKIKAKYAR